jgi:hypothetical protein
MYRVRSTEYRVLGSQFREYQLWAAKPRSSGKQNGAFLLSA